MFSILNDAIEYSSRENLLSVIKKEGFIKWLDKPTTSPYIMAKWTLEEMVQEGLLRVENIKEGPLLFRKKYKVYRLKSMLDKNLETLQCSM